MIPGHTLPYFASERRKDRLTGNEVIIVPGRSARPHEHGKPQKNAEARHIDADCPLCPGNEARTPPSVLTVPANAPWEVRVVPNLYPIVRLGDDAPSAGKRPLSGLQATGIHEVIIETPTHDQEWPDRNVRQIELLLDIMIERLKVLESKPSVRYVSLFKNQGAEAGASLSHPHSQIVALEFVPTDVTRRIRRARHYWQRYAGACLICDTVGLERQEDSRVVFDTEHFIALCPIASQFAGEVMLAPKRHDASLTASSPVERKSMARDLRELMRRVRSTLDDPPFNLVLHTAPAHRKTDPALHWYWQLTPRVGRIAGFEIGTSMMVNTVPPEKAAALLREIAPAEPDTFTG